MGSHPAHSQSQMGNNGGNEKDERHTGKLETQKITKYKNSKKNQPTLSKIRSEQIEAEEGISGKKRKIKKGENSSEKSLK